MKIFEGTSLDMNVNKSGMLLFPPVYHKSLSSLTMKILGFVLNFATWYSLCAITMINMYSDTLHWYLNEKVWCMVANHSNDHVSKKRIQTYYKTNNWFFKKNKAPNKTS